MLARVLAGLVTAWVVAGLLWEVDAANRRADARVERQRDMAEARLLIERMNLDRVERLFIAACLENRVAILGKMIVRCTAKISDTNLDQALTKEEQAKL